MKLSEIMTPDVQVVSPDALIVEAAGKMRSLDVGVLPVTEGKRLVGLITDRDITIRAVAEGRDPKGTRVRDCMTSGTVFCFEDQDSEEAVILMEQQQVRRLPVLSRDRQLVGVVALADIATKLGKEMAGSATVAVSSLDAGASSGSETASGAGPSRSGPPIARNANPAGVSTARQVPNIPSQAEGESGHGGSGERGTAGTGTRRSDIPIARNSNPKGVD
ncbi:MAG: CBS domain-containing protein [Verrucomicrobia bacterium]|nr:CBS domain-containing protein [Verrucomicrobiota bacterium]